MDTKKFTFGICFTVLWLLGLAALTYFKWCEVKGLELNALGDFMAGAFSPLAFFWLVLGYMQQGDELQQNTKALKLQAQELKQAVFEYKELNATHKRTADNQEAEAAERRANELRLMSMELVLLDIRKDHYPNGKSVYSITMRNNGHEGTRVEIASTIPNTVITSENGIIFEHKKTVRIVIRSDSGDPRDGVILFSYVDGRGQNSHVGFDVSILDTGDIHLVSNGPATKKLITPATPKA